MRLVIDLETCRRSGQCMYLYPELIEAGDEGWPRVLVVHPEGKQLEDAQDAADICPTSAITLQDRDE